MAIRGRSALFSNKVNRGSQIGRYLALDRYSDSICHQREKKLRSERHSLSTGPAPSFEPRSKTERNIAKFSET